MDQRIAVVSIDHFLPVRQISGFESVRYAESGRDRAQKLQQQLLRARQPDSQRRRGQDQAAERRQRARSVAGREQAAQAVAEQQRRSREILREVVDDDFRVLQQRIGAGHIAAGAARAAVAAVIVAAHRVAAIVEQARHLRIAAAMLAESMHQHDAGARARADRPIGDIQRRAVGGGKRMFAHLRH